MAVITKAKIMKIPINMDDKKILSKSINSPKIPFPLRVQEEK
ncbi:hypothetical protein [Bacillus sp. ISL-45]|nr:hypothetical protein [Bacillus sp. ISL-45]